MDSDCRAERRRSRLLERRYRRTDLREDRLAWVVHKNKRHRLYRDKERQYWEKYLSSNTNKPRKLWQTIDAVLQRNTNQSTGHNEATDLTAEGLSTFFAEKVNLIRRTTILAPKPAISRLASDCSFDNFKACTNTEVRQTILNSPSKTCSLDPLPTNIVKEFLSELLPFIVQMCNKSLLSGEFLDREKHAIVHRY